jgi:hypothetical protein
MRATRLASLLLALCFGFTSICALAWVFVLPVEKHLTYAILPTEGVDFGTRAMVSLSRLSLRRLTDCPIGAALPETPIGLVVNAYHNEGDRDWFDSMVRSLVESGCRLDDYSAHGLTPLMNAALYGDSWLQARLLAFGANPNLQARSEGKLLGLTAEQIAQRAP